MNRTAYIFVPGILNYPGSASEWTDKAVTWIHVRQTCEAAEKFEYMALPISRRLMAKRRAEQLAALIDRYPAAAFNLVLAGHSNGCDLISRALWIADRPANTVHFFSPAVPADPAFHRLPRLLSGGRVGFLHLYIAGHDGVLSRSHLGGLPVENVRAQFRDEHHTMVYGQPKFGHSSWWGPAQFEATMNLIAPGAHL